MDEISSCLAKSFKFTDNAALKRLKWKKKLATKWGKVPNLNTVSILNYIGNLKLKEGGLLETDLSRIPLDNICVKRQFEISGGA